MGNTTSHSGQSLTQLKNVRIAFTGFRDVELKTVIEAAGGHVMTSVSNSTDYLVYNGYKPSSKALLWKKKGVAIIRKYELGEKLGRVNVDAYKNLLLKRRRDTITTGETAYYTHDNGGRPFQVIVNSSKKLFRVFEDEHHDILKDLYITQTVKPTRYIKMFVGNDNGEQGRGNSLLFQITKKKYMFVGETVSTFNLNDEIVDYKSPIGNSDVPYPFAIGITNSYLINEKLYAPNALVNQNNIANAYYIDHNDLSLFKKIKTVIIRKRVY